MNTAASLLALALGLALAGCGKGGSERAKSQPPLVRVAAPAPHRFVDRIEAVGTARANEQVTLASPVTERIERLHFDDGGYVARGQVIAVLAQGQEQASLAGALAAERQAKAQLGRIESLTGRGFVTRASLEQQTAAAQQARATADDARAQISDRVIRAPFGGYVSLRTISEGAIVGAGTVIATVSDVSRIKLDFSVPETMLASLHKGQALDATAAAFPGRAFRGVVATIDPVIDPTTRAVLVRALLPNPDRALKPGMLLTVRVDAATRQAASLPELAIVGEGSERYVYVVGKDNKAARAAVTTGLRDNGLVEVRGLPADARVIVEGVVKVSDGARVRVQGAPATRAGG
ncbi:efflux RND transporter periplasmic adaptor subunit [Sphingomonas sp. BT553]|uniref:Efflux RND transporter periplasmic adaptor subunit n=2 Tax=Sphingomonas mollis TaxID=2795726 RepID=A0ABS0XNP3_9SPHN|nr:efflux RND transporter periplasmic adaptor subunit [Sphingomonas sp. BT553]MBJ6121656.1 efflux RND transporter periplasmic adaptor subunit [Sphingomonas sp. BT553]